jgi:hypothetical protein
MFSIIATPDAPVEVGPRSTVCVNLDYELARKVRGRIEEVIKRYREAAGRGVSGYVHLYEGLRGEGGGNPIEGFRS